MAGRPDGKTLAYVGSRDSEFDIYTMPVDGGPETRLTHGQGARRWAGLHAGRAVDLLQLGAHRDDADLAHATRRQRPAAGDLRRAVCRLVPASLARRQVAGVRVLRRGGRGAPAVQGRGAAADARWTTPKAAPRVLFELFGGQGTINVPSWSPDSRRSPSCRGDAAVSPCQRNAGRRHRRMPVRAVCHGFDNRREAERRSSDGCGPCLVASLVRQVPHQGRAAGVGAQERGRGAAGRRLHQHPAACAGARGPGPQGRHRRRARRRHPVAHAAHRRGAGRGAEAHRHRRLLHRHQPGRPAGGREPRPAGLQRAVLQHAQRRRTRHRRDRDAAARRAAAQCPGAPR